MSEKIDINTADVATLTTISGIGPALAERIVEYRQTVHPFEEVIELAAVPGISEKMVRAFEDLVTVQPALQALNEPEETPLLDTPEEVILLGAPDQPEGLLAAELPDDASEEAEEDLAAEPIPDETTETAVPDEAEPGTEEVEDEVEEAEAVEEETAVPPVDVPQIEDMPLAEPMNPAMPEPDLFAVAPTQPSAEWEAKAQRRGCLNALLGATFGAILGAVLTLAILAALNQGSLSFAASDSEIRQQLDTEIISRTNELNQLSTRVSLAATEEAATNQTLQSDVAAANEALTDNEAHISELATRAGDMEQRLEDVAGAADTFTDFLDGLRLLLDDVAGGTATPTPTPAPAEETVSPTPTPTPASTNSPVPTATTAVQPTRTPQPTATPFTFPTNTPAPQP